MADGITTAIIDASAEGELAASQQPRQSRYLTCIANRPLIAHVIEGLTRAGIERILIASGAKVRQQLAPVVLAGAPSGVDVSFFDTGSGTSGLPLVPQLRHVVTDRPLLLQPADCLFTGQIRRLRDCFGAEHADLVFLVRSTRGGADESTRAVAGSDVVRLPREHPDGTALVLGPSVWPVLDQLAGQPVSTQGLIALLVAAGHRVRACEVGEHWCYSHSPEGLLSANQLILDSMPFDSAPAKLSEGTKAHGRVLVSSSARVSHSALRGPVVIGPGAVVSDSFIGPYTTIGSRATVIGAEIDYTMVLDDAEIRYPGQRLQSSVIGQGAFVSRAFDLPTGLRLQLEPGSSVILS